MMLFVGNGWFFFLRAILTHYLKDIVKNLLRIYSFNSFWYRSR